MEIKRNVSKLSFLFICLVVTLLLIGTCVLIMTVSFGINPFRSETTAFLSLSFFSLIGMAVVALMLNIAANLSLIADGPKVNSVNNIKDDKKEKRLIKIWVGMTLGTAIFAVLVIIAMDKTSESRKFKLVEGLSSEVLTGNAQLIQKIAADLKAGESTRMAEIPRKLEFLKKQRQDLPELLLIYSDVFEGQTAFRVINSWNLSPLIQEQKYPFYSCTKEIDCDQLKIFFESGVLKSFSVKQKGLDEYSVYYPYEINGARFILMFNKGMRFGSVGKYE